MSPPDAPRPPGGTGGRADDHGDEIDSQCSATPVGLVDPSIEAEALELDRAYFTDHPGEGERVRRALDGELGDGVAWVRVVQIRPGVRARLPWVEAA